MNGVGVKTKTRRVKNTKQKNSSLAELPKALNPVCSDFWLAVSSREPWLGGNGASLKAHGGTRTAKGQTNMGKDKWHKLRGGLPG
jgi:hypothetical protein